MLTRLVLAAAMPLIIASPATATTAEVQSGVLRVTGDPGHNAIAIVPTGSAGAELLVRDVYAPVAVGPGCTQETVNMATCPLPGLAGVVVHLGDGDDEFLTGVPLGVTAYGEGGADWLSTRPPAQSVTFDGGDGNDRLEGGGFDDILRGGAGVDGLDGLDGNDVIDPGPGQDFVADLSGDDRIEAADGQRDYVDCGPGIDTGTFDAFDTANDCEAGMLPAAPAPDCTPEIQPMTRSTVRRLLRAGSAVVPAAVDAPCALLARLTAGGRLLARATMGPENTLLRLRLTPAALRRARAARELTLIVSGSAIDATTITRTFHMRRLPGARSG
jgi:hypothetical protein